MSLFDANCKTKAPVRKKSKQILCNKHISASSTAKSRSDSILVRRPRPSPRAFLFLLIVFLSIFNCYSDKLYRNARSIPLESEASGQFFQLVAGEPMQEQTSSEDKGKNELGIDMTIVDKISFTNQQQQQQHDYRQSATKSTKTIATTSTSTTQSPPNSNANSNTRLTIETAVFLDQALSSRYTSMSQGLADLNKLVLTIMNQVKHMFSYASLMRSIDIKLVLIESLKDSERRNLMSYLPNSERGDIDLYLANFCQWQQARLERAISRESLWWDHAILLSGMDLYKAPQQQQVNNIAQVNQTGVLGLSWVGGMCKGNYSCTIGEALHLESAFVIAHEIGHSLGMMHDGNRNNCDPNKFIMSDKTGAGKVNWSRCSNSYLADALKRQQLTCLTQNSSISGSTDPMYELSKLKPPGQVYSLNDQCKLAYGNNYSRFISLEPPYNNVCQELWCVAGSWARPVHPALEGSSCDRNQDSTLTCREGRCV